MIEARHERKGARARQPAVGRLQAEQAAERGRHADRAVGVGAERERHQAAGDRAARAAGRAAGHAADVVRIARGAVVDVLAGEVVGVFAHVERADQHGAGRLQPRDQRGVARWRARRSRLIFEPASVGRPATSNRFLTANGTPASGPSARPSARRVVDGARLGERARSRDGGEGVERRIALGDARQRRLDHLDGADAAVGDGVGDLGSLAPKPSPSSAQASNTGAGSASSGSGKSATSRASRSVTSRLALTAGFHAGSIGRSSAAAAASMK